MSPIEPFQISVPQSRIENLQQKLALTSYPDELSQSSWDYGVPLEDMKRLIEYWKNGFNWRAQEAKLNALPQFKTSITVDGFDAIDVHFIHQPSTVKESIPLLFVHGWPGSFIEVTKLLSYLSDESGSKPAFSVVAPSLPNFGFSSGAKKTGFSVPQYAEACHKLMLKLGYEEYVTQGGDWGFWITRTIGFRFPQACKASHVNMIPAKQPSFGTSPLLAIEHALRPYSEKDKSGLERSKWFVKEGSGYRHIQGTKPQTLGYGLADSPVGLLAWIFEKLYEWTDGYPWTDDEILTWVSIYWFSSAGPAASLRIYYESMHTDLHWREAATTWIPKVKYGLAYFPKDIYVIPKSWGRTLGNVVHESDSESGGHFAAWEAPKTIANDLQEMFGRKGGAYNVVKGRSGYSLASSRL